jgi:hypothetical protein
MDNYDEIIDKAISLIQGEVLPLGTACAHPTDSMTYLLEGYDGDIAILSWDGVTKRFPASEIFDVNKCQKVSMNIKFGVPPLINIA